MEKTYEDKLYENIDGPGGYENEDPWRYRFLGPHALEAGLAVQFLTPGPNTILELGSAEGLLAMRICETSQAMRVAGSDVPSQRTISEYWGLELSPKAVLTARLRAEGTVWRGILKYLQVDVSHEEAIPEGKFDLVMVSEVLPYLPAEKREGFVQRLFEKRVKDGGHLIVFSWMTSDSGRSYAGDWSVHQVRSEGRMLITKRKGDGEGESPYVYRWVVVQKKAFDWPWATLW